MSFKNSEINHTYSPKIHLSPINSKATKNKDNPEVQLQLDETKEKLQITLEVNNLLRMKISKLETSISEIKYREKSIFQINGGNQNSKKNSVNKI